MNFDNLEVLKEHVEMFDRETPTAGGNVEIIVGPNKGHVAIVGDRAALVRLAVAILNYAICGRGPNGPVNARAMVLRSFFEAPSPARDFMIQMEEISPGHKPGAKPHSTFKVLASLLSKKK